jgi:Tfp pilus assembly protein PilF
MAAAPDKRTKGEVRELRAIYAKAAAYEKRGMLVEAARSFRFFLSKWPEPSAYYNYGLVLKKLGAVTEAIQSYESAIALKPDYGEAYVNIANIHMDRGEYQKALQHYDRALHLNPLLVEGYYNRGVVLQELRRHDDALADYDRTLALQPNHYLAYLNKSVILYELKRKAEATRNYEQILETNPEHIDANWNLGILKLSEGDLPAGWKLSEWRLKFHSHNFNADLQKPYWHGQGNIRGRTMFLKWEQGFGDTIQFCRYARMVMDAGATVILSVQNPLRRLVATLDKGINLIGEDEVPEHYDDYCFLMSLPNAFATAIETIPYPTKYLHTDAADISRWKARVDERPGLKVGLVWAGGLRADITCARRNDANRSIALTQYLPLLSVSGTAFFSLQKGPPGDQLRAAELGDVIQDWTAELEDFADTGALIEALDLVITVDTAVAHLAAALGKPVWILVPWTSCWRWLETRTDSPWYASVRLFRQDELGNWDSVIESVRRELQNLVAVSNPKSSQTIKRI